MRLCELARRARDAGRGWEKNVVLGGFSVWLLDWSVRVSGSPVGLGTQITADFPQTHAFGLLQLRAFGSRKMLASLAAAELRRPTQMGEECFLMRIVFVVVGLIGVYEKSDYFSDSFFAAGELTNRSHSSLLCPKLIRSPTSLLAAFI